MTSQSPTPSAPVNPITPVPDNSESSEQIGLLSRVKGYILGDKLVMGGLIFLGVIIVSGLIALVFSPRSRTNHLPFVSVPVSSATDNLTAILSSPSDSASPSATATPSASPSQSPSIAPSPSATQSASPSPSSS